MIKNVLEKFYNFFITVSDYEFILEIIMPECKRYFPVKSELCEIYIGKNKHYRFNPHAREGVTYDCAQSHHHIDVSIHTPVKA